MNKYITETQIETGAEPSRRRVRTARAATALERQRSGQCVGVIRAETDVLDSRCLAADLAAALTTACARAFVVYSDNLIRV